MAAGVIGSDGADPSLSPAPKVVTVDSDVKAQLPVLGQEAQASDRLPAGLRVALNHFVPQYGAQPDLARRAGSRHGDEIYLVPAVAGVCFVQSGNGELFCASKQDVSDGTAFALDLCSPSLPADKIEIAGVVPVDVRTVAVQLGDGTQHQIDATNGVYSERFDRSGPLPKTIELTDASGHRSVPTNVPADTAGMKCTHPGDLPPASQMPRPASVQTAPTVAP